MPIATVLITGVNGFVGPYLTRACVAHGWEVTGTAFGPQTAPSDIPMRVVQLDVTDRERVLGTIAQIRPDFVMHLAGFSSVKASWSQPELCRRINVDGTRNLLDAMRAHAPEARILIVSSAEVYGIPKTLPITEEHPLAPTSPYGESRVAQEGLLKEYPDLQIIVSRSFNHIGPGQPRGFVIADFCSQIAAIERGAEPVIRVGDLSVRRDFTDVRDVVRAYIMMLEKAEPGTTFNVCSGKAPSLRSILDILLELSSSKTIRVEQDEALTRPVEIPELRGTNDKIVKTIHWSTSIPLKQTLLQTLDQWRRTAGTW